MHNVTETTQTFSFAGNRKVFNALELTQAVAMLHQLKGHIEKFAKVSEQDYLKILAYFKRAEVPKKRNLLVVCKSSYFVVEWCLRMFFINEKGAEQTVQFALAV